MAKKKTNKTREILKYLQTHKRGLTSADAFKKFGSTRLADVIHNLRNEGHEIDTIMEVEKDRYGNDSRFARYQYRGAA